MERESPAQQQRLQALTVLSTFPQGGASCSLISQPQSEERQTLAIPGSHTASSVTSVQEGTRGCVFLRKHGGRAPPQFHAQKGVGPCMPELRASFGYGLHGSEFLSLATFWQVLHLPPPGLAPSPPRKAPLGRLPRQTSQRKDVGQAHSTWSTEVSFPFYFLFSAYFRIMSLPFRAHSFFEPSG